MIATNSIPYAAPSRRISYDGATWVSVHEAADVLGVHWSRIYQLLRQRRLPNWIRAGSPRPRVYIRLDNLATYRTDRDWWRKLHQAREVGVG